MYLITHDHQFRFQNKHLADMCIFTMKSIIKYYIMQNSPVYTCFLDASKVFDRINHWTLFKKLIDCNVPLLIVKSYIFFVSNATSLYQMGQISFSILFNNEWCTPGWYLIPNIVALYMNELSRAWSLCKAGCCYINDQCMNHLGIPTVNNNNNNNFFIRTY